MINPLGFTLEHFDAIGRYRTEEKGRPIDATGSYETRAGRDSEVRRGPRAGRVTWPSATEAHSAFVQQLFHYLVKQPIGAFGPQELPDLRRFFVAHDFNIRKLMVEIMASTALTPRGEKTVELRRANTGPLAADAPGFDQPSQVIAPTAIHATFVESMPEERHGPPKQPT